MTAFVVDGHRRQLECANLVVGQAQANDAAAFADQQGHGFDGKTLGGNDQIGFVLAVVIVLQDHGAAIAHRLQRGGDTRRNGFGVEQREIGERILRDRRRSRKSSKGHS